MDAGRVCPGTSVPHPIPANTARCRGRAHILPIQEDEIMKKRLLSLALSFVMLLTVLPVSVWAEEELAIPAEAPAVETYEAEDVLQTTALPSADMDNDELFMGYLYSKALENEADPAAAAAKSEDGFFVAHPAMMGFSRANTLTEPTKSVYVEIIPEIKKIASGESHSTEITIYPQLLRRTYTAAEFDAAYITQAAYDSAWQQFSDEYGPLVKSFNIDEINELIGALLADMPYELYWYDKTESGGVSFSYTTTRELGDYSQLPGYQYEEGGIPTSVTCYAYYTIKFAVAKSYRANNNDKYTTRDDLSLATSVPETVKTIVAEHAGETDAQKLQSYLSAVCSRVTYNSTAAESTSISYGDPWQLIYVFDGNRNTNVVCEGYAKAFKFLCDLSKWNDPDFDCYLVTGTMNGGTGEGAHMWNIVHIRDANNPNGGNFMVDPTNCDEGSAGAPDMLFMKAPTKLDKDRKYHFAAKSLSGEIVYTYNDTALTTFTTDELTLAEKDYEQPANDQSTGLRYRVVTDVEWADGYSLAQVDAEIRSDLALSADRGMNVQIGFLNSDGTFTVLSADDLTVSGDIALNAPDMRDEEGQPCLRLVPNAPYAGGTITYHNEADGIDYTMNVPVRLPDVGFYSEAQRDKGHYIEELVFNNDPAQDVAYLFWPTDAMLISVEKSKWCTVDYVIENKASMAKDGYAKIVLKSYGSGFADFDVNYQQAGKEPASGYGSLSLEMGVPALGYVGGNWDGEAFQPWGDAEYGLTLWPYSSSDIQVVYFDGERTTPVSLKDLTYNNVTLAALDENGTYITLNSGVNDGSITYHNEADDKDYTLNVSVLLPDVGFYSSDTATKENYLTSYKYTGNEDVVYLFGPADATLISVEKQEWCTVDYEIQNETTMAKDGYARILLKSFGNGYVEFNVKYQQGDEGSFDSYASLSLQMGAIGLGYKYLDWDGGSNTHYPREDVRYNLSLTASYYSSIQVVFFDGVDYIPVSLEDLQFNGIEAEIEEDNHTYLLINPEGANDGSITYHNEADDKDYTLKVSVQLPDVGYYSSSSATKETFLSSFDYKGDNNMVYLVWPDDVTLKSLENTEWCTAEYEIQNEATMAEDHYAAISLHISGDSRLSLRVSLLYPNMEEPIDNIYDLTIRDMSPGLRIVSKWDNETNQPAANAWVWGRVTIQPHGGRIIQLTFFDGETYQLLDPEDVTTTNVILFTLEDGRLVLETLGIDDGTISYQNPKDNKIYTMEIPVQLPDVWYYSSPVASKDTYLNEWVYDGTDKTDTIYLVATNGFKITESPTLLDGSRTAECSTLSGDGTYATIQLTGGQDDFAKPLLFSASLRNGSVQDTRSLYLDIYYSNLTANIELPEDIQGTGYLMSAILRDKDGQPVDGVVWTEMDRNQLLFNYTKPGDYLLEITWSGCVTRTVPVTVEEGKAASVSVPLCAIGNINGAVNEQGQAVDASDMQCLFEYLSMGRINSSLVKDKTDSAQVAYFMQVADVNEDGAVNILDYQALYEMVKTPSN